MSFGSFKFVPFSLGFVGFIGVRSGVPRVCWVHSCSFRWAYGSLGSFGFAWFIPVGLGVIWVCLVYSGCHGVHSVLFGSLQWA